MTATVTSLTPFEEYADDKMRLRYAHVVNGRQESWEDIAVRVVNNVMAEAILQGSGISQSVVLDIIHMIQQRKFIPGGRILSQAGREYHQTDNCFTLRAENTREGWGDLANKVAIMSMSGGGVGVDYSDISPYGTPLRRSGGIASGPIPCIQMVDGILAAARQGGERRGAGYASLPWNHADIFDFIKLKDDNTKLNHTNISTRFNQQWLDEINKHSNIWEGTHPGYVFRRTLAHACKYGDPGFQFDSDEQVLRNACTEIISADDSDSCCIGSINFAAISSLQELSDVTNLATLFLLCNTLYTDFPTCKVKQVKEQNRRLGLGLMGVAEWFIQRNLPYGVRTDYSIYHWLRTYQQQSDNAALHWSTKLNVARPIAVRAIAPTGTISILGHTTPGIEPVFHTAYYRTSNTLKTKEYADGYKRELVVDPIVSKLVEQGYSVEDVDTAYTLSRTIGGIERRLAFQDYVQGFVDNAISTTINLPPYVEGVEDKLAPVVLKYLPQLRGLTFYPDGAHNNQPVVPVDIKDIDMFDRATIDQGPTCKGDSCGS